MLYMFHIENVAVIESADINFGPGLNVLTGETGSGKSIIIDSIDAISGARTSRDIIRTGAKSAYVSAIFQNISPPNLETLARSGIFPDEDGGLLVSREIFADGRNTCLINARPATLSQLKCIGDALINIHGQNTSRILLDLSTHLTLLDEASKNQNEVYRYRESFEKLRLLDEQIAGINLDESQKQIRLDMLSYQINELEQADLSEGEEDELQARRRLLSNAEKIISGLSEAHELLSGTDYAQGAAAQTSAAAGALSRIASYDEQLVALSSRLNEVRFALDDCAGDIARFIDDYDFSSDELNRVEARLDTIYRLRKYGANVSEMLAFLERAKTELADIEFAEERLARLEADRAGALQETMSAGAKLTLSRQNGASLLKERIGQELSQLDMSNVVLEIEFSPCEPAGRGLESVQFLLSANSGEEPRPLSRIASGGELSRIMLAMLSVLSDEADTLIFDEIDTGVSGRAAQRVGNKLSGLTAAKQVLCVTHLSQIASFADEHLYISKYLEDGRTKTRVETLEEESRLEELARINSGDVITPSAIQSAREQLENANKYKSARS